MMAKGGNDTKSVNVAVNNQPPPPPINHPPPSHPFLPTRQALETGKQSTISCQASDPDNDSLTYSWSANGGTFTGSGSTAQWTAPATAGTYAIQCAVSDGRGGNAAGTTDILVNNPIPVKWILPSGTRIRSLAIDQTTSEVYALGMTYGSLPASLMPAGQMCFWLSLIQMAHSAGSSNGGRRKTTMMLVLVA